MLFFLRRISKLNRDHFRLYWSLLGEELCISHPESQSCLRVHCPVFRCTRVCVCTPHQSNDDTGIPRLICQSIEHDVLWLSRAIKHIVMYFCCCILFLSRKADVCHCYRCFGIIFYFWDLIFILALHKLYR